MSAGNKLIQAAAGNAGEAGPARNDATVLLLNGDGTSGAQNNTFTDSSSNNYTVTRTGNTTQGSFSPFSVDDGKWGNYFEGSSDYLSVASDSSLAFGTGDLTIEFWVNYESASANYMFYDGRGTALNNIGLAIYISGSNLYVNSGTSALFTETAPSANTWHHIALTRSGTSLRLFVDGTQPGSTVTNSTNFSTAYSVGIGAPLDSGYTASYSLEGYISNLRVLKGTALYTTDFDVPTTPLTAISGTSLLTCQSNFFVDNSSNAHSITVTGTPKVVPFSPFAQTSAYNASTDGGALYFDGSGDDLNVGSNSNWTFLSNNNSTGYTIEFWVYYEQASQGVVLATDYERAGTGIAYTVGQGELKYNLFVNNSGNGSTKTFGNLSLLRNAWNYIHIKSSRVSSVSEEIVITNGSSGRSQTQSTFINYATNAPRFALHVGQSPANGGELTGYLCDLRIKSVAESYSSVPTAPLTSDANTKLLLSGQDAGIIDTAGKTALTTGGTIQIDTAEKKYGTGSIEFSANGNLITAKSAVQSLGGGDFTIEMWINHKSTGNMLILSQGGVGDTRSFAMQVFSNALYWQSPYGTVNIFNNTYTSMNDGNWHHLAVVRSSGTITMYFDGVAQTNTASNGTNYDRSDYPFSFSNDGSLNAYIDDLRITKGFARYTGNFTPPTEALAAHDEA